MTPLLAIILLMAIAATGAGVFLFVNRQVARTLSEQAEKPERSGHHPQAASRPWAVSINAALRRGTRRQPQHKSFRFGIGNGRHTAAWALSGALLAILCAAVWGVSCAGVLAYALCAILAAVTAFDWATRIIPNTLVAAVALVGVAALALSTACAAMPALSTAVPLPDPFDWGGTLGTVSSYSATGTGLAASIEAPISNPAAAPALTSALPHVLFPTLGVTAGDRIVGIFAASVPLLIAAIVTNGFGGGDIKLLAALGLCLGWQLVLLTFFGAILLGGLYAIWLLATKRASRKDAFAFGPFICTAAGIAAIAGDRLAPILFAVVGLS